MIRVTVQRLPRRVDRFSMTALARSMEQPCKAVSQVRIARGRLVVL